MAKLVLNPGDFYAELRDLVKRWRLKVDAYEDARTILESDADPEDKLRDLDRVLKTHGVEAIPPSAQEPAFLYLNTGESYESTVMYSTGDEKFFVSSWGDTFEVWEREEAVPEAWQSWIRERVESGIRSRLSRDEDRGAVSPETVERVEQALDDYDSDELRRSFEKILREINGEIIVEGDGSVAVHLLDDAIDELYGDLVHGHQQQSMNPSGAALGGEDFISELKRQITVDRQVLAKPPGTPSSVVRGLPPTGQLYVNFINLPRSYSGVGGAETENNRMMFVVDGFGRGQNLPPPSGKVRVEQMVSMLPREYRLRAKTGTPSTIASYLAAFINRVGSEVPPKYTHSSQAPNARRRRAAQVGSIEEDTVIIPEAVASGVVDELRMKFDTEFPGLEDKLVRQAEAFYKSNDRFRKRIRSADGRDWLWSFMRHWAASDLRRESPEISRKLPPDFARGLPLERE